MIDTTIPRLSASARAIANAVSDAIGIRVADTPINPTQLARLLDEEKKEA